MGSRLIFGQLLKNASGTHFQTWTRWGRVGERGQMAMLGDGTLAHATNKFEEKFKGKSGLNWENRGDDPKKGKCECA
jgi:poly [ADP-ribose] polymerase